MLSRSVLGERVWICPAALEKRWETRHSSVREIGTEFCLGDDTYGADIHNDLAPELVDSRRPSICIFAF